jgi:hypothetical protein
VQWRRDLPRSESKEMGMTLDVSYDAAERQDMKTLLSAKGRDSSSRTQLTTSGNKRESPFP